MKLKKNIISLEKVIKIQEGKLDKEGGNMTGPLFLSREPVENNEAATKSYVDSQEAQRLVQTTGNNTTKTMSQKSATDRFYKSANSNIIAGNIYIQSETPPSDAPEGSLWFKI